MRVIAAMVGKYEEKRPMEQWSNWTDEELETEYKI